MISFEVEHGDIMPVVVCDFCHARIAGDGYARWLMPSLWKPSNPRFSFESPVFHTHKHCSSAFEVAYGERHGYTRFFGCELWALIALTLNNVVTHDDRQAQKIFDSVKRVVEAERKP